MGIPNESWIHSDVQDAAIFGADGNNADTVLVWYNVNGDSTANRSFSFNIGATSIGLTVLMLQMAWHCRAVGSM